MVPSLRPRRAEAQPNQAKVGPEDELEEDEAPRIRDIRVNVGRGGPASVRSCDHHRDREESGEHRHGHRRSSRDHHAGEDRRREHHQHRGDRELEPSRGDRHQSRSGGGRRGRSRDRRSRMPTPRGRRSPSRPETRRSPRSWSRGSRSPGSGRGRSGSSRRRRPRRSPRRRLATRKKSARMPRSGSASPGTMSRKMKDLAFMVKKLERKQRDTYQYKNTGIAKQSEFLQQAGDWLEDSLKTKLEKEMGRVPTGLQEVITAVIHLGRDKYR